MCDRMIELTAIMRGETGASISERLAAARELMDYWDTIERKEEL